MYYCAACLGRARKEGEELVIGEKECFPIIDEVLCCPRCKGEDVFEDEDLWCPDCKETISPEEGEKIGTICPNYCYDYEADESQWVVGQNYAFSKLTAKPPREPTIFPIKWR